MFGVGPEDVTLGGEARGALVTEVNIESGKSRVGRTVGEDRGACV